MGGSTAECAAILSREHTKQMDWDTLMCGGYSGLGVVSTLAGFIVPIAWVIGYLLWQRHREAKERERQAQEPKPCPTPKSAAMDEATARGHAKRLTSNYSECRAYLCQCASWHITFDSKLCPTPEKMVIGTESAALAQAKRVTAKYGEKQRAYLCQCGQWHLTTMSEEDYQRSLH